MCKTTRITTATVNASLPDLHLKVRETRMLVVEGSIPQSPSSLLRAGELFIYPGQDLVIYLSVAR
jgi:hypothetical protein